MASKKERQLKLKQAQRVQIVGYDFDLSDDEIDDMIDMCVRFAERAMVNPRFIRLISLGNLFKQ